MAGQSTSYTWDELFQSNLTSPSNYDEWCWDPLTLPFDEALAPEVDPTCTSGRAPAESLPACFDSIDMNDPHNLYLYTRVVLFFASSEPTLEIENCDRTTENALRLFAARFHLEQWYNAEAQTSMIRRPQQASQSISSNKDHIIGSLIPRSSSLDNMPKALLNPPPLSSFDFPFEHHPTGLVQPSLLDDVAQHSPLKNTCRQDMRALRIAGGACWRCKILRKKCDTGQPCKACPRSSIRSIWQTIGCQRGALYKGEIKLCPGPRHPERNLPPCSDLIEEFLRKEVGRMYSHFESPSLVKDEGGGNPILPRGVLEFVPQSCQGHRHNFRDCVNRILWEIEDNPRASDLLRITSPSRLSKLLFTAAQYEIEHGKSALVITSLACLIPCLQYCRLAVSGFLGEDTHHNCTKDSCNIKVSTDLELHLKGYADELSQVIFRKENLQNDRRWWLSVFYSLYIQNHVRHALIMIEEQTTPFQPQESSIASKCTWSSKDYLHTVVTLFAGISAGYDPLTLPHNEAWTAPPELLKYVKQARDIFAADGSTTVTLDSSFDLLEDLFEIDQEQRVPRARSRSATHENPAAQQDPPGRSWGLDIQVEYNQIPPPLPPPRDYDQSDQSFDLLDDISTSSSTNDWLPRLKRRANSPPKDLGFPGVRSSTESLNEKFMQHSLSRKASSSSMNSAFESGTEFSQSSRPLTVEEINSLEQEFLRNSNPTGIHQKELAAKIGIDFSRINKWFQNRRAQERRQARMTELENLSARPAALDDGESTVNPKDIHISDLCKSKVTNLAETSNDAPGFKAALQSVPLTHGYSLCTCCPKKPKRFSTLLTLKEHEAEKQFECSYCGNRFKNMNEKQRHENSLHVRRRTWSCSRIRDAYSVFFAVREESAQSQVDECGYCGKRFPAASVATEEDLEDRLKHVVEVHKWRECNSSKTFYRADHFRQHLKYSHSALAGNWIEEYCEEEVEAASTI